MAPESPDATARLCNVCSNLSIQHLAYPLHPCRKLGACWEAPTDRGHVGGYLTLGSRDEINDRRSTCDLCNLIAGCLDKVPPEFTGKCRITESDEYCRFTLPRSTKVRDPSVTHFHLTQATVMFNTSLSNQFHGPSLPWNLKSEEKRKSHYLLHLQAKARNGSRSSDSGSIAPRTEHEFLNTLGGRYVGTQVNTQLIRSWLHHCETEHGNDCMPSVHLPAERLKEPAFVIDVTKACLVESPSQCRYVALSYVWGNAIVFRHLLENTQSLRKPDSLHSLPIPATIRDAITLVCAIGERYLWVDSLCIIQDDLRMQQTEIARMGSIYSRALFTIIAAGGDHANSGLPGVSPGSRQQVQKILKLPDCELLMVIDVYSSQNGIDKTVWAGRGWTFQERVLSNRVLVFSETQVYWTCRLASHSEERALEEIRNVDRLRLPFNQKKDGDCISWKSLSPVEYCRLYDNILYNYRHRHLTYETDILNALNGVTEMLGVLQKDRFFWGLPESYFSHALTWWMIGRSSRNHAEVPILQNNGSKVITPIPSWTWAAWSGENSTKLDPAVEDKNIARPLVQFYIVDNERKMVTINERPLQSLDRSSDRVRSLLQNVQSPQPRSHLIEASLKIGCLRFWTSLVTVKAVQEWGEGLIGMSYLLNPPQSFRANPNAKYRRSEIVLQDFIVVALRGSTLILFAVEWKDGVAYRVGKTEIVLEDWLSIENRQWRLIALG